MPDANLVLNQTKDFSTVIDGKLKGNGECLVRIGYDLNEPSKKDRSVNERLFCGWSRTEVAPGFHMIRESDEDPGIETMPEIRIAVLGNVDAGKSTTLGVLTGGHLDDGRGMARYRK